MTIPDQGPQHTGRAPTIQDDELFVVELTGGGGADGKGPYNWVHLLPIPGGLWEPDPTISGRDAWHNNGPKKFCLPMRTQLHWAETANEHRFG